MRKKIYKLSDVAPSLGKKHDSVRSYGTVNSTKKRDDLFLRAQQAWENLRRVREIGERTEHYTFADDQWGDLIWVDGEQMTEREYIQRQGNVPLTDNMMISIFSSIIGLYDKQGSEPNAVARDNRNVGLSDMMSATLQCNWQNNKVPRTLSVGWRTFLNTGIAMVRSTYDMMEDGIPDVNTQLVNPYKAFWEAGTDPNMRDLTLIGQLCDISKEKLYQTFAKKEFGLSVEKLNEIYHINTPWESQPNINEYYDGSTNNDYNNERNNLDNVSFSSPNTPHSYRVIEVWTQESKSRIQCWDPLGESQEEAYYKVEMEQKEIDAINRINSLRRKQCREAGITDEVEMPLIKTENIIDVYWFYTFLAPDGTVLCSGETPYDHRSHPFTLLLYPYVNGKIYPYMSFVIDQQRNVNRLNIMNDLAIRSATKGLTIYPEDIIPDDMTPDEFNDQLTSYRGIVRYKVNRMNPNARPDILTSSPANLGINEMLQMKINLMQQTANVSGALQGKTPSAGTAASRYAMEAENSTTSLFSILNDFSGFMENIALKNCELIKQFYEDKRLIFVDKGEVNMMEYDRMPASDVKFKVSIKESAATAAYQQRIVDSLNMLLERQVIDVLQYLDNSPEPFAKTLAQQIRTAQQQNQLAQAQLQVPGANQQAVAQAEDMMGMNQFNQQTA